MKSYDRQTKTGRRSPAQNAEIDVAMAAIQKHRKTGECFSLAFIASIAGVDRKTIHNIASNAQRKVANELYDIKMNLEL